MADDAEPAVRHRERGRHRVLGWDDPVAFLSQRSAPVSVFGVEIDVPVALLTVMAFETWRYFPFAFLFLTARISALPGDLEEAAVVDGATASQRFRYVVFPQLLPTIALLAVLRFIFTFNEFDDIYLLTGGARRHPGGQRPGLRPAHRPRRHRCGVGAGAGARRRARGAAGGLLPVRRPADGGGRREHAALDPRPRREPRVRRAAVGGDRGPRARDPPAVLLHDHPVGAAPR